ncbi:MAG: hypothetical protein FWE21_05200 [Defluviitaleaceae bacterium]|nr:hypothetical protein [Defluviitaleaceae bacterium]
MEFVLYDNLQDFKSDTLETLMEMKAQNTFMISQMKAGGFSVKNGGEIVLVGLVDEQNKLMLFAVDNMINKAAIKFMIDRLDAAISSVYAEDFLAKAFAEEYGKPQKSTKPLRVYEATRINPKVPKYPFRQKDDCAYVLDVDSNEVSQLKVCDIKGDLICLDEIQTPPDFRKKGYASSLTAQVSQLYLDKGKTCILHTNPQNTATNNIFKAIGYLPVCDFLEIEFRED